jgi:EAL domain-containing protein (putative c-di-GMP-specific phosphodiesterase class I)
MVEVARGLDRKTISEPETIELLHDYGVDYAQGYHLVTRARSRRY